MKTTTNILRLFSNQISRPKLTVHYWESSIAGKPKPHPIMAVPASYLGIGNVGHISISLHLKDSIKYVSIWPVKENDPLASSDLAQSITSNILSDSLETDIETEVAQPQNKEVFLTEEQSLMLAKKVKEVKKSVKDGTFPTWALLTDNCAKLVYDILYEAKIIDLPKPVICTPKNIFDLVNNNVEKAIYLEKSKYFLGPNQS